MQSAGASLARSKRDKLRLVAGWSYRRTNAVKFGLTLHFQATGLDSLEKQSIIRVAGWSSLVARLPHKEKVAGSNPAPATSMRMGVGT